MIITYYELQHWNVGSAAFGFHPTIHYFVWHSYHWHQYYLWSEAFKCSITASSTDPRCLVTSAATGGGGATGAVCPRPPGPQPVLDLFKISLSVTFQSSFFKGLVLLYFRVRSACSSAVFYAAEANYLSGYCTVRYLGPHRSHFSIWNR